MVEAACPTRRVGVKFAAFAFAVLPVLACSGTRAAPLAGDGDRARIVALEQHWLAAIRSGNRRALENILADGFTDVTINGEMRDRADAIAHVVAPAGTTQTITRLNVRVFGDTAIATGINAVHSKVQGWTVEVAFTDVFVREHGQWRAASAQETLRKPASAAPSH